MPKSFTEYCKCYLYEIITNKVRDYVEDQGYELQGLEISRANVYDLPELKIGFDIAVNYECSYYDCFEDNSESKQDMLLVQGSLDLGRRDVKPVINSINDYTGMPHREFLLSDSLVPQLTDWQGMDVANNLLKEFYPEHLSQPEALDVDLLIERMGLQVVNVSISDSKIKSQIVLRDGYFEGNYYEAGTILVDEEKSMVWGVPSHRFNLVHECVHWFCHRKWALWESFLEDKDVVSEWDFVNSGEFDGSFIESQTNKIASMVLVPCQTLNAVVNDFMLWVPQPIQQEDYLGILPDLLNHVKDTFGISKKAAKIRLQQCRVELMDGIGNYVDGHTVRDYVFNPDALPDNGFIYTFTISDKDAFRIGESNPKIREYLELGALVYVENHIVVNSPRFIQDTDDGYMLTDYALTHMDECAVRFYTWVEVLPNSAGGGSLSRKNGGNSVAYCQVDEELSLEDLLEEKVRTAIRKELEAMSDSNFQFNLRLVLKTRHVKQDHLQNIIDKSGSTIARMFNKDYDPKKGDILHLCLALKIPWEISEKLLFSAGIILHSQNEPDCTVKRILIYFRGLSYNKKLELLEKQNISL